MVGELTLKNDVEVFYTNVVKDSEDEFCIDLDILYQDETGEMVPIWQWSGYSTKEKAAYKTKKLEEGVDYKLHKDVKLKGSRTGQKINQYLFSIDGFKQFLMLSNTTRGRQIRLYFIEAEKKLQGEMAQPTVLTQQLRQIAGELVGSLRKISFETKENAFAHQVNTQAIAEHTEDIKIVKKDVENVKKQLDKIKSRKDPKQADKDACMKLVESDLFYKSFCPCCDQKTETFQIDHFYDSSKNHLSEIWPVCKPCNQTLGVGGDLKDGSFRKEKERNFMAFQQILQNQNRPKNIQKSLF
jgi:phage anti-repressor protein